LRWSDLFQRHSERRHRYAGANGFHADIFRFIRNAEDNDLSALERETVPRAQLVALHASATRAMSAHPANSPLSVPGVAIGAGQKDLDIADIGQTIFRA